ncbi:uncharacterized protein LOC135088527 isoform X2 [Ostrinia nubilalis]|uniref:uncharacterized protein LOC135086277 n=1 Tax=Ostrinia nubilalis TaxID=29057 RepID=UPI0030822B23
MSDSEYESAIVESRISKSERRNPALIIRSDSEAENGTRRDQAKTSKKKSNNRAPSKSDSEDDQPSKRSKAKTTKRKSTTSRSSKTATPKRRNTKKEEDLFGLVSEDEEDAAHANASRRAPSSQLPSSISSKVADGSVLRRAQLSGRYYAELRLYSTRDALDTRPETRYTKALVTLKLQLDPDQPEWDLLQKFLRRAKTTYFADSVPVFYNNKIN